MPEIPVYDVTSISFCRGVTAFTTENVLCALRSVGIIEHMKLFAVVPVVVYDKLLQNNMIEYRGEDTFWGKFKIEIDPNDKCSSNVVDTLLTDGKTSVILRTREY